MAHFGGMDLPTILTGLLTATVCYTACLPLSSAQPMAAVAVGRCGGVLSGRRGARYRHLVRRLVNESVPAHACPRSQWVAHCGRYPARFPRPAFGPEHGPAHVGRTVAKGRPDKTHRTGGNHSRFARGGKAHR